jgi:hypothetical protein
MVFPVFDISLSASTMSFASSSTIPSSLLAGWQMIQSSELKLINIPSDTANRLNLIGSHYSPDYNRTVICANQFVVLDLDYKFNLDAALNILFRNDQFPFLLHHVPAFCWFTGFHEDYHQITDTENKINYEKMKKIIQLAYLSAFTFANEKIPPRFIENPVPNHPSIGKINGKNYH